MAPKQLRLPKCGGRREDKHPRACLYRTMDLLGQIEERALTALEDFTYDDYPDLGPLDDPYIPAEQEYDRCVEQAQTFYATVIAPVYRSWWLA